MLICVVLAFGCATQQKDSAKLTEGEIEVFHNYQASPGMLRQVSRICLAHRLTKADVIRFMGKTMRTEVADRTVEYFWMPSQVLTFTFDENSVIRNAGLGFKKLSREDMK